MKKKRSLLIISVCMVFMIFFNIVSTIPVGALEENLNKVIDSYNLPEYYKSISTEEKQEIINTIRNDPTAFQSKTYYYEVDELSILQSYVNSSEQDLLDSGFSSESIKENRLIIKHLLELSDDELIHLYDRSPSEIKALRAALTPRLQNSTFGAPFKKVISKNTLKFTMSFLNYVSSPTPKIDIIVRFEWLRAPYVALTDEIAIYWGGGLNSKDFTLSCWKAPNLVKMEHDHDPKIDVNKRYNIDVGYSITKTPNAGAKYVMNLMSSASFIAGEGRFTLYDTIPKTGKTIEIVSQYFHETMKGGDITISYPPGINVGFGYDESDQVQLSITI